MPDPQTSSIIAECRAIDTHAAEAYQRLANSTNDSGLKDFWRQMAAEEATHIEYWDTLAKIDSEVSLPPVFEEPAKVLDELKHLAQEARSLLEDPIEKLLLKDAFLLAYRFEFYMLHPAFERLFHALRRSAGDKSPEDDYEEHVDRFVAMLSIHGYLTPEFRLISDTLQRLWKENKKLAHQAMRDPLTGLFNRRGFLQVAEQILHVARRAGSKVGLLMMDIDDFKIVNDKFGHLQGDSVLSSVANILVNAVRASDVTARFGGEEFVILLLAAEPESVAALAEKIRSTISSQSIGGHHVTISVGTADAVAPSAARRDLHDLIQTADRRMYSAKAAGKNRVVSID